jgi:hypothetical protein
METRTTFETIRITVADFAIATVKTLIVLAMLAVLLAGIGQIAPG